MQKTVKTIASANQLIASFEQTLHLNGNRITKGPLYAGVDLGTANIVTAVVDENGLPVAGALTGGRSIIRDGLIVEYIRAIDILKKQINMLRNAGYMIQEAAAAYPPGTGGRNIKAFGNVLAAVGLKVVGLIDEPTAASIILNVENGAVVDIGGGTTGISVIKNKRVVYTADEPTGGTHVDLTIAGHYKIQDHQAEQMKLDPDRQAEIFPLIRPVFQKMASIVNAHLRKNPVETLYLVGGTSCFPGIESVIQDETGLSVVRPYNPLLVTPLGIALGLLKNKLIEF